MPFLFLTGVVSTTMLIMQGVLFDVVLADVVEENEVRTGQREVGVFFAASLFIRKCVTGLGVFSSAALLSLSGFPPHANPGTIPGETLLRMGEIYVSVIVVLNVLPVACVMLFRISRTVHANNLAILAKRRDARIGSEKKMFLINIQGPSRLQRQSTDS